MYVVPTLDRQSLEKFANIYIYHTDPPRPSSWKIRLKVLQRDFQVFKTLFSVPSFPDSAPLYRGRGKLAVPDVTAA